METKETETYKDFHTKNKTFVEMSKFLRMVGVKNNSFMLSLNNQDLIGVDPYDPNLSDEMKKTVVEECKENLWYFLREAARIPTNYPGGGYFTFELNPATLSVAYSMWMSHSLYINAPRQTHKDTAALLCDIWQTYRNLRLHNPKCASSREKTWKQIELRSALGYISEAFKYEAPTNVHESRYETYMVPDCEFNIRGPELCERILFEYNKRRHNSTLWIMTSVNYNNLRKFPMVLLWIQQQFTLQKWWWMFDLDDYETPWFTHINIDADQMGYTDEEQEEKSRMLGGDVESVNAEIKMIREWK